MKDRLRELRKAKGWTQMQAAVALGVSLRTVAAWESGEKEPDTPSLRKLAEQFGTGTVAELLEVAS